ncbi:ABC transporter substrate-binding protein [Paenibacillus soyae]|uniref:Extracellular solute-binding protein n=1 Tax=Paenibacillus soyae TaxID=2969249 RepID=A0A9X2MUN5_9BACL|nr:extracellular solute-binding protein [Paenibacillus soyae]MCR2806642.1 extracellular solute-binding protein [Paenibacillus soyae]
MAKNNRRHSFTIMLSILLCVVLSSCTANAPSEDVSPAPRSTTNSDSGDLRILATLEEQSWIVDEYKRKYPGREVVWDYAEGDALLEKLASAPAPDLVIAGNELLNTLSGSDLLEDVGQEPYLAGELIQKKWFNGLTLTPFTSMDGQSLIAVPKDFPMAGTFYRADLLEKYGFPSDPEGLAAFMESPQNWTRLAETLKSHDVGVIGYTHEVLQVAATGYGYFDQNGNYSRNTESLAPYASLMLEVESKGLASNWNMWDDKGQQAIREGKLALLYMGEWGFDLIKQWDPEHLEQWKFTRLPFNAYWVHGGSFFSIMRDSPNKASAWEYIQLSMELEGSYRESLPGWAWHSKVRDYRSSPLAAKAEEIWNKQLQSLIQTDISGPQLLQTLETRILEELGQDLEIYHELLSDTLRN